MDRVITLQNRYPRSSLQNTVVNLADNKMIELKDIEAASERLHGRVNRTPILENDGINECLNGRILFKPECLQKTGSFKIRGATNKISSLPAEQLTNGVVAYSSGNHAQGVASAAAQQGIPATIVMPRDAPKIKLENTRALGANVVLYDRYTESREDIATRIADEQGAVIVRPYDDEAIIQGQATVGLEISQQVNGSIDAVLVPCGGGGLVSGIASAMGYLRPDSAIYAVEPEGFDDTANSLRSGERQAVVPGKQSICDSIITPMPGEITFSINQKLLAGCLVVSELAVKQAVVSAFMSLKLVVEPGAAVGLAALFEGHFDANGKTVVVVLSGGNMDMPTLANCFEAVGKPT